VLVEIEESITGTRHLSEPQRVSATVFLTDIVGSTERACAVGDREWRTTLDEHDGVELRISVQVRRDFGNEGPTFAAPLA
jgi:hypothetical protein